MKNLFATLVLSTFILSSIVNAECSAVQTGSDYINVCDDYEFPPQVIGGDWDRMVIEKLIACEDDPSSLCVAQHVETNTNANIYNTVFEWVHRTESPQDLPWGYTMFFSSDYWPASVREEGMYRIFIEDTNSGVEFKATPAYGEADHETRTGTTFSYPGWGFRTYDFGGWKVYGKSPIWSVKARYNEDQPWCKGHYNEGTYKTNYYGEILMSEFNFCW